MQMNRRLFMESAAAVAGALGSARMANAQAALPQAADRSGFIFGSGPVGSCDSGKLGGPIVKWHPGEKQWWMWYYCRDAAWPKDVAPGFGTGRVALAKSRDGIVWDRHDGHLALGSIFVPNEDPQAFDSSHVASGDVLYHDGLWIMAYFGGDQEIPNKVGGVEVYPPYKAKGYRGRPGIATSSDGIHWERVRGKGTGGAAVDIGDYIYAAFPNIIHDGRRYLLYYAKLSPRILFWETHVAESIDLINWTELGEVGWSKDMAVWERGGSVTRNIIPNPDRRGPKWIMTYSALDARWMDYPRTIGLAGSNDAITWTRLLDEPILGRGSVKSWDGGGVTFSSVVTKDDTVRLYYFGYKVEQYAALEPTLGIGLATARQGRWNSLLKLDQT